MTDHEPLQGIHQDEVGLWMRDVANHLVGQDRSSWNFAVVPCKRNGDGEDCLMLTAVSKEDPDNNRNGVVPIALIADPIYLSDLVTLPFDMSYVDRTTGKVEEPS